MNHQPRGLVDDNHVFVLVEDAESRRGAWWCAAVVRGLFGFEGGVRLPAVLLLPRVPHYPGGLPCEWVVDCAATLFCRPVHILLVVNRDQEYFAAAELSRGTRPRPVVCVIRGRYEARPKEARYAAARESEGVGDKAIQPRSHGSGRSDDAIVESSAEEVGRCTMPEDSPRMPEDAPSPSH